MNVLVSWSGGKDSALALSMILRDARYRVSTLLTTVSAQFDRVSMHGVRRRVLEEQADALGLPLQQVAIGASRAAADSSYLTFPTNDIYEEAMLAALRRARAEGVEAVVFGDIFLQDLREYRDRLLAAAGLTGIYPLWKMDCDEVLGNFIEAGFEAFVVCVDERRLDQSWLGREIDDTFAAMLPADVDVCGENGEFHTFVHAGPIFDRRVMVEKAGQVRREPFWFLDLECSPLGPRGA